MRSLCGPQARLRSEQPVAENENHREAQIRPRRWQKGAQRCPAPRRHERASNATCAQQEWTGLPTRTERPVSSRAPLSTAWLARHSAIFTIARSGHRVSRRKFAIRAFDAA